LAKEVELNREQLLDLYRQMQLIRIFEDKSAEMYMDGNIRGFLHLYTGEEAIAVGTAAALSPDDYVVSHYRDHGHALARGISPEAIMAELFGKATGCSGGRGGSMHLIDSSKNFTGGYAIVGGQLPIATGLALAAKELQNHRIVLCFFGDGAINQGEFHEALNLASLWGLPVIFFLENNLYGMGSHIERTYAGGRHVWKAAEHYQIPAAQVDGMDVLAVLEATQHAAQQVRSGGGPYFLEGLTYRFRGHSMADPISYRDQTEDQFWRERDPLITFKDKLLKSKEINEADFKEIFNWVESKVAASISYANASSEPESDSLFQYIFAE